MHRRFALLVVAFVLSATAYAQDLMKAEWYTTKKQVIAAEGKPQKEDDDTLFFKKEVQGHSFNYMFNFENRMLTMASATTQGSFFSEIVDSFIEEYGRPYTIQNGTYTWKNSNHWIDLWESDSIIGIDLFPPDEDRPWLDD